MLKRALYRDADGVVADLAGNGVAAEAIAFTPAGSIAATDVQAAIEEVASEAGGGAVDSVFGRTGTVVAATSDYAADQIDFTPAGTISATDVQAAIEEVASEATGGATFGTPAIVLGTAAAAGSTDEVIRRDSTIVAFDGTAPTTQAFGDSAATGSAAVAARRDHKHAMPAAPTTVSGNAGTATALQTARNIDGQSFDGTADITVIAPGTHAATSKTTPIDADELPLVDTAASNVLKKLTLTNLKAYLKTYFDTLYASVSGSGVVEYDYAENTNTTITLSGASAAAASTIITGASVSYDGSTRIKIEFGCYSINNGAVIELYDSSTDLGRMGFASGGNHFYGSRILTPSSGSHQFIIKGWRTTGSNGTIDSGAGGSNTVLPAWYRITKA